MTENVVRITPSGRRIPSKAQLVSLKRLRDRAPETHPSYIRLRRNAFWEFGYSQPALMVPWCGMYVGIEPDGYAHS